MKRLGQGQGRFPNSGVRLAPGPTTLFCLSAFGDRAHGWLPLERALNMAWYKFYKTLSLSRPPARCLSVTSLSDKLEKHWLFLCVLRFGKSRSGPGRIADGGPDHLPRTKENPRPLPAALPHQCSEVCALPLLGQSGLWSRDTFKTLCLRNDEETGPP